MAGSTAKKARFLEHILRLVHLPHCTLSCCSLLDLPRWPRDPQKLTTLMQPQDPRVTPTTSSIAEPLLPPDHHLSCTDRTPFLDRREGEGDVDEQGVCGVRGYITGCCSICEQESRQAYRMRGMSALPLLVSSGFQCRALVRWRIRSTRLALLLTLGFGGFC